MWSFPRGSRRLGRGNFYECMSLHAILVIPPSVREIPARAFSWCSCLTNVVLPKGLEEIGEWAFDKCTSLHAIVMIPPSIKKIPLRAFHSHSCSQLTNVGHSANTHHCMPL
jgi:hypothetical protein